LRLQFYINRLQTGLGPLTLFARQRVQGHVVPDVLLCYEEVGQTLPVFNPIFRHFHGLDGAHIVGDFILDNSKALVLLGGGHRIDVGRRKQLVLSLDSL